MVLVWKSKNWQITYFYSLFSLELLLETTYTAYRYITNTCPDQMTSTTCSPNQVEWVTAWKINKVFFLMLTIIDVWFINLDYESHRYFLTFFQGKMILLLDNIVSLVICVKNFRSTECTNTCLFSNCLDK